VLAGGRLDARLAGDSCRQSKPEGVSVGLAVLAAAPAVVAPHSLCLDNNVSQSNPAVVSRGCLVSLVVLANLALGVRAALRDGSDPRWSLPSISRSTIGGGSSGSVSSSAKMIIGAHLGLPCAG
jgi:hypothetical protein